MELQYYYDSIVRYKCTKTVIGGLLHEKKNRNVNENLRVCEDERLHRLFPAAIRQRTRVLGWFASAHLLE